MKFQRFAITQATAIMALAIMTLITLSVVIVLLNYNFEIASEQRTQTLSLTKAIHNSDSQNDNETRQLVDTVLDKIVKVSKEQKNSTKILSDLLLENQKIIKANQGIIKNTTATNLASTFVNRRNIQSLTDAVRTFNLTQVKESQEHEVAELDMIHKDLARLLNSTRH